MNNYFTLTRVFFFAGFNTSKKKKNQKSAFVVFGLTMLLMAGISLLYSFNYLYNMNYDPDLFLVLAVMFTVLLSFTMSLTQMQNVIFNTRDYEILESFPIRKYTIVAAKISSVMLTNIAEDAAILIPVAIVYMTKGGSAMSMGMLLATIPFVSFLPILLSSVIGSLAALFTARSGHSVVISLIINLVFTFGFLALYIVMLMSSNDGILSIFNNVFYMKWIYRYIEGEIIYYLYFFLLNLLSFILVILFVALLYRPVNSMMNAGGKKTIYTGETKKNDRISLGKTLFKKECKLFFSKPSYVINSIMGPIMAIILSILMIFGSDIFMGNAEATEEEMQFAKTLFSSITPGMCLMMMSVATPASASISMEGRNNYELLRAYPISGDAIIQAKFKLSMLVTGISAIVAILIILVVMLCSGNRDPYLVFEMATIPFSGAVLCSVVSMLTGLKWPKLDYENEGQVLKSSAAVNMVVLFTMIPSMFVTAGIVVVNLLCANHYAIGFPILGTILVIYWLIIGLLWSKVKNKGPKMFDNIINR